MTSGPSRTGRLQFCFKDFIDEIDTISEIAKGFIAPASAHTFPNSRTTLQNIRESASGRLYTWSIPVGHPLATVVSKDYERGRKSRYPVFAKITSIWEIEPVEIHGPKSAQSRVFSIAGKASTRVGIFRCLPGGKTEEIAMWRMEIGDSASPGSYFHIQVLGELNEKPFPSYLSIPRFPCFLPTPPVALEFVLGELFQDKWLEHVSTETSIVKHWRSIQRDRFLRILKWQKDRLDGLSSGSPWTVLKRLQPPDALFL